MHVSDKYEFRGENECLGSYHVECTGSRPITEVKQRRARLYQIFNKCYRDNDGRNFDDHFQVFIRIIHTLTWVDSD